MATLDAPLKLLVSLYARHNMHFEDKAKRSQLEKEMKAIISALPAEEMVSLP